MKSPVYFDHFVALVFVWNLMHKEMVRTISTLF